MSSIYPNITKSAFSKAILPRSVGFLERQFFTADGTTTSGSFAPVTLRGDCRIPFKLINGAAAGIRTILGHSVGVLNQVYCEGTSVKARLGGIAIHDFGAVTSNKLLSAVLVRTGADWTLEIDGVAQGTAYTAPGDAIFDRVGSNAGVAFFDNVISDLEIIDLDQPAARDVLTFGGVNEYGTVAAWEPTSGSNLVFEFETNAVMGGATRYLFDSRAAGTNGSVIALNVASGLIDVSPGSGTCVWSGVVITVDGVATSAVPTDGALHKIRVGLTQTGSSPNPIRIGSSYFGSGFLLGALLDVKLHDLTTPSNSRRYRMDVESNSTIVDDYGSANSLTLNNVISSDWERMTRDVATGDWVGPLTTIADSTYVQPANILWRMDQGRFGAGAYETNARSVDGLPQLALSNVVAGDWELFFKVGVDWFNAAKTRILAKA